MITSKETLCVDQNTNSLFLFMYVSHINYGEKWFAYRNKRIHLMSLNGPIDFDQIEGEIGC